MGNMSRLADSERVFLSLSEGKGREADLPGGRWSQPVNSMIRELSTESSQVRGRIGREDRSLNMAIRLAGWY